MSVRKKRPKPTPAPGSGQPRKTALITGVTGQDGSYLAELLLAKGYEVVGVVRRTSHDSYERIGHLLDRVHIVPADLLDQHSLTTVVRDAKPDEIYNLAAQSFVPTSWTQRRASTRRARPRCSARCGRRRSARRRRFIRALPTASPRCTAT